MLFFNPEGKQWSQTEKGYYKITVDQSPADRVEIINLNSGQIMPPHFHSQLDEVATFIFGTGTIKIGKETHFIVPGTIALLRRGMVHTMENTSGGALQYSVVCRRNGIHPSIWMDEYQFRYPYGIYSIIDPVGQQLALPLMNQIKRWQRMDGPSDPEQYITKGQKSDIKILLFYDYENLVGSSFVGRAEGYDLEKTQAMIEYGKGNPENIGPEDIWLNYQSWEELAGESPTALDKDGLKAIWGSFKAACQEAFPKAKRVVVRSRHSKIWNYVYIPFWDVLSQVDLRGFEWRSPDDRVFKGYDERFSEYGILALSL